MWRFLLLFTFTCPAWAHQTPHIQAYFTLEDYTVEKSNAADIDTPFAIASVGKIFTSLALLRLADQGVLDLDDPVADWVDDDVVEGLGGLHGITLRHLANMTAGLPDYYDGDFIDLLEETPKAQATASFALSQVYGEDVLFEAGSRFDYSNTNYLLLGLVLENASGQSYAEVIETQVIRPLRLEGSFVFGSRPLPDTFPSGHEGFAHVRDYYEGNGYGDGGVISTARDVATLYQALRAGVFLSSNARNDLTTQGADEVYGMGLVLMDDAVGHSGGDLGFSSYVVMDWKTGDVAVELMGGSDKALDWPDEAIFGD